MFKSTRVGKTRAKTDDNNRSDGGSKSSSSTSARTYAPFPTPYQYHPQNEAASATPVLMHEPYQTRQQDSTGYEQTPSPITTHSYPADHTSYSQSNTPAAPGPYLSSGYAISSSSMSPVTSHSSHLPSYQMTSLHSTNPGAPYYSSSSSHSPWDGNGSAAYYPRNDQHQPPSGMSSAKPSSFPASSSYRLNGTQPPASPHSPYPAPFPAANVHGAANPVFSPSYSLHAALALPGNEDMPGGASGPPLSPLHIPDRAHSSAGSHSSLPYAHGSAGGSDVPMGAGGDDGASEGGLLAPLSLLRPPVVKYVRDLQDEKILRRLRERNSNS